MKLKIGAGTSEEFFKRALGRAKTMDRGERLTPEMRITFKDPAELRRALTEKRVEIILAISKQSAGISEIAGNRNRDIIDVDCDVEVPESGGW